ncbi:MAG TPA: HIT domain-containing protein [Candidatus Acidoferrum sp.]|jgi:histidine triad (HIT) family protein|nr:HIT domain-containing protein [Candidatus Acidoferrum sp.]
MDDCIFCRIAGGGVPAKIIHRDDDVIAIEDLNPQAPSHALVLPVRHHGTIVDLMRDEPAVAARLIAVASQLGSDRGGERGFRLVVNTGEYGGQTVDHVHVHVLAGRRMSWPPG